MPSLNIDVFRSEFTALTDDWTWEVQGFLDTQGNVHPIDSDTKVISTVFERLAAPVIRSVASAHGYTVETANQTTYPDFTLTNAGSGDRIALDIKTTYLKQRMGFTLGGYASFLVNNTKNILYPYNSYRSHWVLGYIYSQNAHFTDYDLESLPGPGEIACPYDVRAVFIREKHDLCGLRAGSGNTKNIGSFNAEDPSHFSMRSGPFANFIQAKAACDLYWANYDKYKYEIYTIHDLMNHSDFQQFR